MHQIYTFNAVTAFSDRRLPVQAVYHKDAAPARVQVYYVVLAAGSRVDLLTTN